MPLLVADVYQLAGAFRDLGNQIAGQVGETQARWQVLSVVSGGPHTVAQIARRLGYARQSVQRTADNLIQASMAEYKPNPDHATSPLVEISARGVSVLGRITTEAEEWNRRLASEVKRKELAIALRVIRQIRSALETAPNKEKSVRRLRAKG